MSVGSMLGALATLGFVLGLLGIALKLLRRFAPNASTGKRVRMEIVQRMAIGPKQGIAVVRIADRYVAVSVGDGGIRRLFDLENSEIGTEVLGARRSALGDSDYTEVGALPAAGKKIDFAAIMKGALKTAGLGLMLAASVSMPRSAHAQTPATKPAATPPTAAQLTAIARQAAAGTRAGTSPAEMVTRLTRQAAPAAPSAESRAPSTQAPALPQLDLKLGGPKADGLHLSGTVGVVVMMGLLTLLPTLLLMMTGFTRILIVLNFLKQALGTQSAPPNQLVAGLAMLLTGFVMAPTLSEVNRTALTPWLDGKIDQTQMLEIGQKPFRAFMLRQTRRADIETFVRMSGNVKPASIADVPLVTLTSAFVISELRTAFQIGFALFLPFIVIDVVVSSVLMSMGMFMLPPAMISLPFKLLLFVLVDGWSLVIQSLVTSFR